MNSNMTAPLAWAALVSEFDTERLVVPGQHGPIEAVTVDTPTVDMATHDAESERWEAVAEYVELVVGEMLAQGEAEATERLVAEGLAEIAALYEPVVAVEQPAKPVRRTHVPMDDEPNLRLVAFRENGASFEPTADGQLVLACCESCQAKASGPVLLVRESMAKHREQAHRTQRQGTPEQDKRSLVALDTDRKRCVEHGVWARQSDGKCKRCDVPADAERDAKTEALRRAIAAILTEQANVASRPVAEPVAEVTHAVTQADPARPTLGIRGSGKLASRSAKVLAELTGISAKELAAMTGDEAKAVAAEHKVDANWVPATQL